MKQHFFLIAPVLCAPLLFAHVSCVNGKFNPLAAQVIEGLDTAGCELVAVSVSNQEAGDICSTAAKFFNGILSGLSAPTPSDAGIPMAAPRTAVRSKYPVKYQGVTVGHFFKPYDAAIQAKLDAMPIEKAHDLTKP